ncbi:Retrovirus-related Pol polyprotein from transposon gypsy, partial [Smittium culicis]
WRNMQNLPNSKEKKSLQPNKTELKTVQENPVDYVSHEQVFGGPYLHHLVPNTGPTSLFSGTEVEEFLELYEVITKGLDGERKVKLFTRYCIPDLVNEIKWTEEYESGDWNMFYEMLKSRYRKKKKSDPFNEIENLVKKGIDPENTEAFFQNFNYLANKLVKGDYITKRQKTEYLLNSLPYDLIEKLSSDLIDDGEFKSYEKVSQIITKHLLSKNKIDKFKKNITKNNFKIEPPNRNLNPIINTTNQAKMNNSNTEISTISEKEVKHILNDDNLKDKDVIDLVKKMGAMVLNIQKSVNEMKEIKPNTYVGYERVVKCIYCDGSHSKRDCKDLQDDVNKGMVKLDERKNDILPNGTQLSPNYGNGGMKAFVHQKTIDNNLISVAADYMDSDSDFYEDSRKDTINSFEIVSEKKFEELLDSFAVKRKDEDIPLSERIKISRTDHLKDLNVDERLKTHEKHEEFPEAPYSMKARIVNTSLQKNVIKKCKDALVTFSLEEIATISPFVRKTLNDDFRLRKEVKVDRIETNEEKNTSSTWKKNYLSVGSGRIKGLIQGVKIMLMFDEGSEINVMSEAVYNGLVSLNRANLDTSVKWKMRDANSGSSSLLGLVKDCEIEIEGVIVITSIFVSSTSKTPVILGRPWDVKSRAVKENRNDGSLWYTIMDEKFDKKSNFCVSYPEDMRRFEDRADNFDERNEIESFKIDVIKNIKDWGYEPLVLTRYKAAKDKIKPKSVALSETESPAIQDKDIEKKIYSRRLTEERLSKLVVGESNLSKEEIELFHSELKKNDKAFAYLPEEMGILSESVEKPIYVETVEHEPWQVKPYPIPKGIENDVKYMLKDKLLKGILEPSNGPYSNNWFCIKKKQGGYRFIQDVQKVNEVTKRNAGKPPFVDAFSEDFSGCKIYTTFDLLSGYDQIPLDKRSRDLFSLQTPLGLLRMTRLPQGWTNSVQVFQRLMTKVFIKHIPEILGIFVDDGCVKGVRSGGDEEILPGIRKFVYDHIMDVSKVLDTMIRAGLTVSGEKCRFGVESAKLT